MMNQASKVVAIMPWGNEIEDFLTPLGLDLDAFCERMTGGWLFGTVQALQEQGWRVLVICVSSGVDHPTRRVHAPTGASMIFLPSARFYRALRRRSPKSLWRVVRNRLVRAGVSSASSTAHCEPRCRISRPR